LKSIKQNAAKQALGCKNAPLLELELDHIVPDELHLLLRVMDMLIQALIDTAAAHDHYEAHSSGTGSSKAEDGPMVQNLVKKIKDCGVHFYVWADKKKEQLQWPSIMGTAKKKLLSQLPDKFSACQPSYMAEDLTKLWKVRTQQYYLTRPCIQLIGFQCYLQHNSIERTI